MKKIINKLTDVTHMNSYIGWPFPILFYNRKSIYQFEYIFHAIHELVPQ